MVELPEVHASVKLGAVIWVPEEAHLGTGLTSDNGHQGSKARQNQPGLKHHPCLEIIVSPILPNRKNLQVFYGINIF